MSYYDDIDPIGESTEDIKNCTCKKPSIKLDRQGEEYCSYCGNNIN
jgi:hypothetical protein